MTVVAFEARRFRSTAAYYQRYRVPYPAELIASVAERLGLAHGDRVLDLGCGPAMLGLGFARLGMDATGIDPEPEMLAAAEASAREAGLPIALIQGSSYELGPHLGRFRLVVMGRSFHWMDRLATLALLDTLIEPGGAVALFHDRRIETTPDWRPAYEALSAKYAAGRNAERGRDRRHEPVLLQSAFSAVESRGFIFDRPLTSDDIVGRAYSMSVTSPETLGANQPAFEQELRAELAALAPDGRFHEIVAAEAIMAFRPGDAT